LMMLWKIMEGVSLLLSHVDFVIKTSIVWLLLSYKHRFHPFYLGAMLKNSNKCCVCKHLIISGKLVAHYPTKKKLQIVSSLSE
jgi:hypothetical protein